MQYVLFMFVHRLFRDVSNLHDSNDTHVGQHLKICGVTNDNHN